MEQDSTREKQYQEGEVSIKELVLRIKDYWIELLRKWWLVLLIASVFSVIFLYRSYKTSTVYQANISFMINDDDGGGGLASIVGSFGFDIGGKSADFNQDRIVALASSEKIVHPVLKDSAIVGGKNDLIANHIIEYYELQKFWRDNGRIEELFDFKFSAPDVNPNDRVAQTALNQCYRYVVGGKELTHLTACSYDENTGIMFLKTSTVSEELSLAITNRLYDELSNFYILQQTEPQIKSLTTLKMKADSLQRLLEEKEMTLASLRDANRNVVLNKYQLREARLQREIPAYVQQYAQVLQNLESADFILRNKTPFFQVIDRPNYPLKKISVSRFSALFTGGITGAVLAILFIIGRKVFKDAMEE